MKQQLLFTAFFFSLLVSSAFSQGVWQTASSVGFSGSTAQVSVVISGKIYVIGSPSPIQVFDPVSNSWSHADTLIAPLAFTNILTAAAIDNKIYIVATDTSGFPAKTVYVFDPSTKTWESLNTNGAFTFTIGKLSSAVLHGKMYVIGVDTGYNNLLEIFDPATNSWSIPITTGQTAAGVSCAVGDSMYILMSEQGITRVDFTLDSIAILIFDPTALQWTTLIPSGSYNHRKEFAVTVFDNKIYVLGGDTSHTYLADGATSALDVFDPKTVSWSTPVTKGSMSPRFLLTASTVGNKIYAMGGGSGRGDIVFNLDTNEVLTPNASSVKNEDELIPLQISPNPTTGIIAVHNAPANMLHVTITNVLGETVSEVANPRAADFTIDISKLPSGTYFAKFLGGSEVITHKIIKE